MLDWDLVVLIIISILAYLLTLHIKNLNLFVKLQFIESEFLLSKKCTSFLTKSSKKKVHNNKHKIILCMILTIGIFFFLIIGITVDI